MRANTLTLAAKNPEKIHVDVYFKLQNLQILNMSKALKGN